MNIISGGVSLAVSLAVFPHPYHIIMHMILTSSINKLALYMNFHHLAGQPAIFRILKKQARHLSFPPSLERFIHLNLRYDGYSCESVALTLRWNHTPIGASVIVR